MVKGPLGLSQKIKRYLFLKMFSPFEIAIMSFQFSALELYVQCLHFFVEGFYAVLSKFVLLIVFDTINKASYLKSWHLHLAQRVGF